MTRIFFALLTFMSFSAQAQLTFNFDKRFVECEDQWVVFKMDKDSIYKYGFIYIDEEAGLTFNYEGSFKQRGNEVFDLEKVDEGSIKYRLEPNNVKVAFIPENLFKDLQIDQTPKWLKFYKTNLDTVKQQYIRGYTYNAWDECAKALPFLLKAKELDPNFEGLDVEIAFSYNCLKEFDKAAAVLEKAIQENPTDAYTNKEYIYSLIKTKEIDKAVTQFYSAVKVIKENTYNAENC